MLPTIKPLLIAGLACAILAGCAGSPQTGLSGTVPSDAAARALHLSSEIGQIPVVPSTKSERGESQVCSAAGGTLTIPTLSGKKKALILSGSLQYGQNNCTAKPKTKIFVESESYGSGQCSLLPGYQTAVFQAELTIGPPGTGPYTFSGDGLTGTVSSSTLDPSTSYTVILAGAGSGLLIEEPVGVPVNGTLTFTSPLQNGTTWLSGGYSRILLEVCYPS